MRPPLLFLGLTGALLLGGCAHNPGATPPPPVGLRLPSAPGTAPHRLLHVYVDCGLRSEGPERNRALAETIALTLRDQLRARGYDVRGAEPTARAESASVATAAALARLGSLAQEVAAGTPPPTSARYATYLHPNAPRLLFFVAANTGPAGKPHRKPGLQLGGFLADSVTGEILWSGRTTVRTSDDQAVRRLAALLLHGLSLQPPS